MGDCSLPYAPYTNRSLFLNNWSHKRKLRDQTSKGRTPLPPTSSWSCQGTSSGNCPRSGFCKVFYSLFSFLCVLFSLHKWKNASGEASPSGSVGSTPRCHPTPSWAPAPSSKGHLNPSCLLVYLLPLLEAKILGISFIIRFQGGKEKVAL